jgi:hypothetical protein
MYKLSKHITSGEVNFIIRLSDNAYIPLDPANMDFVEYQKWLSEGNVPLPVDKPSA